MAQEVTGLVIGFTYHPVVSSLNIIYYYLRQESPLPHTPPPPPALTPPPSRGRNPNRNHVDQVQLNQRVALSSILVNSTYTCNWEDFLLTAYRAFYLQPRASPYILGLLLGAQGILLTA